MLLGFGFHGWLRDIPQASRRVSTRHARDECVRHGLAHKLLFLYGDVEEQILIAGLGVAEAR